MTSTNEEESKKSLKLSRPGRLELKKTVDAGQVRQSFPHGRSKAVSVEVKRKRTFAPGAGGRAARLRALEDARHHEELRRAMDAELRRQAEEESRRQAEEEEARRQEEERAKAEADARAKLTETTAPTDGKDAATEAAAVAKPATATAA